MKKSILSFVMALFVAQLAHSAEKWELPKATLRSVYMPQSKTGNIELIRLYSDKTFEHLIYEPTGYSKNNPAKELKFHLSKVEINKGKYSLESGNLKLVPLDKEFSSALYDKTYFIENSRVYESRWKSIFKKDQFLLKSVSKAKYDMPFFLDPYSHLIVTNEDAVERIDLSLVVNYLVKNITDQKEKLHQLVSFIRSSIEYDYAGAESKKFLNEQDDAATILAGKNRLAVCAGYALTLKDLLSRTGMEAKYVTGYARVNKYETYELGELHAWNIITIGKSKEIHDITWGEQWYDVDPAIMIHSHFPEDPADQLLEKPITKEQYKQMPFAEKMVDPAPTASTGPSFKDSHSTSVQETSSCCILEANNAKSNIKVLTEQHPKKCAARLQGAKSTVQKTLMMRRDGDLKFLRDGLTVKT